MQKFTKIVATIGPVSESYESLEALAHAGVNVFRLNFSHGTYAWHGEVIKRIRRLNKKSDQNFAILLDTKGPEIRSGDLSAPIELSAGDEMILSIDPHSKYEVNKKVGVSYDGFINDVEVGGKILVDSGVMSLEVLSKDEQDIVCKVLEDGTLTSRRHLNLPGKDVSLESITEKDWEDINFGIEMGVDFIALSFVRKADEIIELQQYLESKKAKIDVIAKIESFEATRHLGTICEAADGLMVARGDLGAEIPFSQVPRVQREIIHTASQYQKPVIVATHMLESMIEYPVPTRAEVTDVSEAVWQRSDAVMLSGETAGGEYPVRSVEVMAEIIKETEDEIIGRKPRPLEIASHRGEFAKIAADMAMDLDDIKAMVVITRSGYMAHLVSSFRPRVPIFAFTNTPNVRRKLQLGWGIEAFRIDFSSVPQKTINRARESFLKQYPDWKGKQFILLSDSLVDKEYVPTLQIRQF